MSSLRWRLALAFALLAAAVAGGVGIVVYEVTAGDLLTRARATAVAQVLYRADGRAEKIAILAAPEGEGCKDAVVAILTASSAPLWRLPDVTAPDVLLLRLDDESLECAAPPNPAVGSPTEARRIGGTITPPRKVKDVPPVYPAYARQQGIQGVVIIDAEITPTGCVHAMRMLHSEHPGLAAAALTAVGRWRYTPTLLNAWRCR